jgi:hypothetical protein
MATADAQDMMVVAVNEEEDATLLMIDRQTWKLKSARDRLAVFHAKTKVVCQPYIYKYILLCMAFSIIREENVDSCSCLYWVCVIYSYVAQACEMGVRIYPKQDSHI